MKILVITRNAWDDTNAIGNTVSNFFEHFDNCEFANIYFRASSPNNKICKRYYRTTEFEVLRNWFSPEKNGKDFNFSGESKAKKIRDEKKLIRLIHKYGINFAYKFSDYIWNSKKWLNNNLRAFIESFSPDVIFTFAKADPQYYLTVKYIKDNYNTPLFTWIADDEYGRLSKKNSYKKITKLKYIIENSNIIKGCSREICSYYNSVFSCSASPLYKSCEFSETVKEKVNNPVKVVYAGNLLYGRLEIITKAAEIIEGYKSGGGVSFDIFSNSVLLPSDIQKYFGDKTCTCFCGKRDYDEIKRKLCEADLVLFVESFDTEQIINTKYSFSTKIIDYLQSGSAVLAIGPGEISSIKYFDDIPGAYVIKNTDSLKNELVDVLNDSSNYSRRALKIREFAEEHHDASAVSRGLQADLSKIIIGGV